MNYKITQTEPDIGRLEKKYVNDCLKRRWITEGKYAHEFLYKIKEYTGAKYAVLAPNGTLAIYMALQVLGIKPKDHVLVPDFTFNATASPLHFLGATPVFCDVDQFTFQMDVNEAEQLIKDFKIKAIVPVHFYGQSVDMDPLMDLVRENDILVMEDAAQGLGVFYKDKHVGTFGDAGIFAFYGDKNIVMGEGGVVVTNNENTYDSLLRLRNQGRLSSGSFQHEALGMNFRITDLQCALGTAQMETIDEKIRYRKELYRLYEECLHELYLTGHLRLMRRTEGSTHMPLRMPVIFKNMKTLMKVIPHLEFHGVQTRLLETPLHLQPCWKHLRYGADAFPVANDLVQRGLKLPMHNRLRTSDVEYICQKIKEAVQ